MEIYRLILCAFVLLHQSVEKTVSSQPNATTVPESDATEKTLQVENEAVKPSKQNNSEDRSAHGKMLSLQDLFVTTTTERPTPYDYWWFLTTSRRPFISYRDYPGKPGVATWKEISPVADKPDSNNPSKEDPMAASVSSNAISWLTNLHPETFYTSLIMVQYLMLQIL